MKSKLSKSRIILTGLLGISLFIMMFQTTLVLVIKNESNNEILFAERVQPGYQFATLIRHSVQRTPVYEYYRVEGDGKLLVTGTVLQDLGWGMPSDLAHTIKFENGFMVMEEIDRSLQNLPFRISYMAEPCLIIDDEKIDLRKYAGDSELIMIYTSKTPYFISLMRGETHVF